MLINYNKYFNLYYKLMYLICNFDKRWEVLNFRKFIGILYVLFVKVYI